jgi:hypothetical protein
MIVALRRGLMECKVPGSSLDVYGPAEPGLTATMTP